MRVSSSTFEVPIRDQVTDESGLLSRVWENFFRSIRKNLEPLGSEKFADILNNQASAVDIEGLSFDLRTVSQVSVDYLIQRVTTGGGATELIETGTFYLVYKPTSLTWVLSNGPSASGLTFSVTANGQVRYTSSNITGTPSISKIIYRARVLAGKNSQYSEAGR